MKRFIIILALVLVASASFCQEKSKLNYTANIKTDVDTISYAIGQINGGQLQMFLEQQGMDSTCIADFIIGFEEGSKAVGNKKKQAYYMGLMQGTQMVEGFNHNIFGEEEGEDKLSVNNMMAGLIAGINNDYSIFNPLDIQEKLDGMVTAIHERTIAKKYKENKEAGEKFLAKNASKRGVKKFPSGVQYKVVKKAKGAIPTSEDKVKVHYEGKLIDGTVFDSSYERGKPAEMHVNQVVSGFAEALTHMPVGSIWEVYIPAEQAYGERDMNEIKPFSTLIFKIELLEILEKEESDIDYDENEEKR